MGTTFKNNTRGWDRSPENTTTVQSTTTINLGWVMGTITCPKPVQNPVQEWEGTGRWESACNGNRTINKGNVVGRKGNWGTTAGGGT